MLEYSKAPADGRLLSTSMVVQRYPCPPGPLNPKPEVACKLPLFYAQRTNRFSDPCETKKGTFKKQIPLLPTSCSFTQQTLNHMRRLDSPSVSAETLKP